MGAYDNMSNIVTASRDFHIESRLRLVWLVVLSLFSYNAVLTFKGGFL